MRKLSDNDFNALINGGLYRVHGNAKRRKAVKMVARAVRTLGQRGWPALGEAAGLGPLTPGSVTGRVSANPPIQQVPCEFVTDCQPVKPLTPKQRVLAKYPQARLVPDSEDGGYRVLLETGLPISSGPTANAAWAAAAKAV